jgi:uncharacterized protein (DUF697 family)
MVLAYIFSKVVFFGLVTVGVPEPLAKPVGQVAGHAIAAVTADPISAWLTANDPF